MVIPIINDGNSALLGVETYVDPVDGLTKNRILVGSDIGGDDIVLPQSSLSIDGGEFGDVSSIVFDYYNRVWVSLNSVELVTPPIMLASPKNVAIDVDPNSPLAWTGTEGATYVVNFWETQDPNAPAYAIETTDESINVKEYLKWDTIYSWQVHEITTGEITFSTPIWQFWTDEYKCSEELIGDLNGDCVVDLADFALLAGNWLVDVPKVPKSS